MKYTPNVFSNTSNNEKSQRKTQNVNAFLIIGLTLARAGYVIRRGVITYKSGNKTREVTRLITRAGGDQ